MISSAVDTIVTESMDAFSVPGLAIAIIRHGEIALLEGYGLQSVSSRAPVNTETLFGIGSNTKAMTSTALAILVDDGLIAWNDRVIDHLPEFRLADPYITRDFRIRDLLIHQSGLGLGAGDLMLTPATDFTVDEILAGMRYLPCVGEFRSDFTYNNLMYILSGELLGRVSGMSWADFVESRLFRPAGMNRSFATLETAPKRNVSARHILNAGVLDEVAPEIMGCGVSGPAGSVVCDIGDVAKWLQLNLKKGLAANGARIISSKQFDELTTPRSFKLPVDPLHREIFRTSFYTYAFGWNVRDVLGRREVTHTGGLPGMFTMVTMLPDMNFGLAVLTNQQSPDCVNAISWPLLVAELGGEQRDWIKVIMEDKARRSGAFEALEARVGETVAAAGPPPMPLQDYIGTYTDPWRGEAYVSREDAALRLRFSRTSYLAGNLEHYSNGVFVVRWDDRTLEADAFVRFEADFDGSIKGMTMKAVSDRTDFSFDFHDLRFTRTRHLPNNG